MSTLLWFAPNRRARLLCKSHNTDVQTFGLSVRTPQCPAAPTIRGMDKLVSAVDLSTKIDVSLPATGWVFLASFLVFIMVPSIGLLEAGLTRRKNVLHGLMKSLSAAGVMSIIFALFGFSTTFSGESFGGIFGNPGTFALGNNFNSLWPVAFGTDGAPSAGIPLPVFLLFQTMFAAVTLALVGAGVPERMKFGAWLVYCIFVGVIVYPLIGHMVWSPNGLFATLGTVTGLLPGMGARDFAGGIVVHIQAGVAGLAITMALGASVKRRHTISLKNSAALEAGVAQHMEKEASEKYGYSIPLAIVGTALLWFGWFGFNPGSSLDLNFQSAFAAVNTNLAAALGCMVALVLARALDGKWDPIMAVSGILGGLVMITPNAGYVDTIGAGVLGILAGVVTVLAIKMMDKYLYHVDDPVGGFPVHGVNGLIGSLVVPLFANPAVAGIGGLTQPGLFYGGGGNAIIWLLLQAIAVLVSTVIVFVASYGFVKVAAMFMNVRATVQEEVEGLDLVDHGVAATTDLDDLRAVPAATPA
jgi:ammonium transporter, Amt family